MFRLPVIALLMGLFACGRLYDGALQPKDVSLEYSSLRVGPSSAPANARAAVTVVAHLADSANRPLSNRRIALSAVGAAAPHLVPTGVTNVNGDFETTLVSSGFGHNTLYARDVATGMVLKSSVDFTQVTPWCPSGSMPTFALTTTLADAGAPAWIVATDFDQDANLDLLASDSSSGGLRVWYGLGGGNFTTAVYSGPRGASYPCPNTIATADLDGDGIDDVVLTDYVSGTYSIALGAKGNRSPVVQTLPTGIDSPSTLALADFNNDGFIDMAVTNSTAAGGKNFVATFPGKGNGQFVFTPHIKEIDIGQAYTGTAMDYDGDGNMDLLLSNFYTGVSYVEQGNGDFDFLSNAQVLVNAGYLGTLPAATTDFDGDGVEDALLVYFKNAFCSQLGSASGGFRTAQCYGQGVQSYTPNVADFDGDGVEDLAFANASNGLSIALGAGDGTLRSFASIAVAGAHGGSAVGDFNKDGRPDVALLTNATNGSVSIFLQNGCN